MKWFPLLFANAKTVFFTSSIFDSIAIWQALSPAIFHHYKANDSWMSRQFSDNHWCRRERRSLPASRPFLSADGGSAFQSAVEAKSIAPFSNLRPIIPHLGPEEIQFCSQSVEVGINKEWPIPGGLLLCSPIFCHTSLSNASFHSLHSRHNNRICWILFPSHLTTWGSISMVWQLPRIWKSHAWHDMTTVV